MLTAIRGTIKLSLFGGVKTIIADSQDRLPAVIAGLERSGEERC